MVKSTVIAITRNPSLARTLRTAMTAAGADVHIASSTAELDSGPLSAELLLFHWALEGDGSDGRGELELAILAELADRLPPGGRVIVLLPRGDLATTVAAMGSHERVAGVMVADRLRVAELTAVTTRLLNGDIFGLDKVLPWGARVHSLLVGDYAEKAEAVRRISSFAAAVGLRRYHRERIERCCDEMIMNALYDAPASAASEPLAGVFLAPGPANAPPWDEDDDAGAAAERRDPPPVPPRQAPRGSARSLPPEDRAVVEFGCDGQHFAVAVRDRFGRFERETLLQYLHKCLYSDQQIDDKPGGAGLGLYLISRSATSVLFNLLPGAATECICIFDIETPTVELEQIGRASCRERVFITV